MTYEYSLQMSTQIRCHARLNKWNCHSTDTIGFRRPMCVFFLRTVVLPQPRVKKVEYRRWPFVDAERLPAGKLFTFFAMRRSIVLAFIIFLVPVSCTAHKKRLELSIIWFVQIAASSSMFLVSMIKRDGYTRESNRKRSFKEQRKIKQIYKAFWRGRIYFLKRNEVP